MHDANLDETGRLSLEPVQRRLLGLMLTVSASLGVLALAGSGAWAEGAAVVAAFLFVYAAAAIVSQLPDQWGGARGRAWIGRHVSDLGAGFYGIMGLASFLLLEIDTLRDDLSGPTPIRSFVSELGLQWLIGFSIDSFKNFVQALIWPALLLSKLGPAGAAAASALCWSLLWSASRLLPARCLTGADDDSAESA